MSVYEKINRLCQIFEVAPPEIIIECHYTCKTPCKYSSCYRLFDQKMCFKSENPSTHEIAHEFKHYLDHIDIGSPPSIVTTELIRLLDEIEACNFARSFEDYGHLDDTILFPHQDEGRVTKRRSRRHR